MILLGSAALLIPVTAYSLPASHYASESVLATGRWARIKVSGTGMHIISDAEIRKAGFTDPSKVHVFGLGGRQVSDALCETTPNDLPLQPSVRTDRGIVFFATDHFTWKPSSVSTSRPYAHTIHSYSDDSYYFISDITVDDAMSASDATSQGGSGNTITEFTSRYVYEKEMESAGESGSQIYGEDFRSRRSQTFELPMPDRVADTDATAMIRFAAKTSNGSSTLTFKANGTALPSSVNDQIPSVRSDLYCGVAETYKSITTGGETVTLGIDYTQTGVLYKARLDYIEAFYTRRLALRDGEVHFYGTFSAGDSPSVAGCSSATQIWDVTNPAAVTRVDYTLDDDKARFSINVSGYREFVAFNPSNVTTSALTDGTVANQNIHAMPTPDMLIITLPQYREGAERIAALHESADGFRVAVLNVQDIYNEFSSGKTDVGAFRKLLKMWYDRGVSDDGHSIRYCLLMGKPLYDNKMLMAETRNAGYTPMPIYESYTGLSEESSFCNDDYIGMLADVKEGAFAIATADINIAVGRLPVTSSKQALQMAAKIEKYVTEAELGPWRNKVMLIADDDDASVHLEQSEIAYNNARSNGNGGSFVYDRLYLDSYRRVLTNIGPTYPQATERMMRNYNDGVLFTNYVGHASPTGWGHEHLWDWSSIISMTNRNLTFMYGATCGFSYWDKHDTSGAEELLLNPEAGIIGMMAAARTVYVDRNGPLNRNTLSYLFRYDKDGNALRFGDVYLAGKNSYRNSNTLRYVFLGDPAIRIPNPTLNVSITSINGVALGLSEDYPELPARSTVVIEGDIVNPDGSVATDFNGTVNLQLYDGERVITTFGQGSSGTSVSYNDRDKRLSTATAKVTDGHWTATLRVPPEIQGLYTTAMIACYAYDDNRREANGISTDLYVYGYNDTPESDTDGPKIESIYVNTPNFENGALVNSNPVVVARISDESGINISDSGIGHSMTLTVDESDIHSDLNTYFTLDPEVENCGTLAYPLTGITAGKHSLTLTVWDNANNVTKANLDINVGAAVDPVIYGITASTTTTSVDFHIALDRPNTAMKCSVGIFDLNGRRIWSEDQTMNSDIESNISTSWSLCDSGGNRVPRGIYICRVTVETPEGTYSSKSKKIAVAAEK